MMLGEVGTIELFAAMILFQVGTIELFAAMIRFQIEMMLSETGTMASRERSFPL
jgi:hypothetical protein